MTSKKNAPKSVVSIKGVEAPLKKIFSEDYVFEIPGFQRPYSWTEEEAGILFDDLFEFYINESDTENYFLGSIVLIKTEDDSHSIVIDGQQRLTTLTILLSAIANTLKELKKSNRVFSYIFEEGNDAEDIPPEYRLSLREKDREFFKKLIQTSETDVSSLKIDSLSDPQYLIASNFNLLLQKVSVFKNDEDLYNFFKFLINRCYLVVVSTPSQDSAFRVFSVMNNRGLDLLAIDILKADVIGAISETNQEDYTKTWEDIEEKLGRDEFNNLIGHIRTIILKAKAKKSILEEFSTIVKEHYSGEEGSIKLIDDLLNPYSDAYKVVKQSNYVSKDANNVNDYLHWLNMLDNSDWIPPAIAYYHINKNDAVKLQVFFTKLERLAAYLRVRSIDVTHRIERYARVISAIESGVDQDILASLELTEEEKLRFLETLNDEIYLMTSNKAFYILFRLDSFLSDGSASYNYSVKSIEHVLPQNPDPDGEWCKIWPVEQREYWTNRLANLVLLNKRTNSKAGNKPFADKKENYFKKDGIAAFNLTKELDEYAEWTPEIVSQRQIKLINTFKVKWDLNTISQQEGVQNNSSSS